MAYPAATCICVRTPMRNLADEQHNQDERCSARVDARSRRVPAGGGPADTRRSTLVYGVVVDTVNVNVLLYAPVRSACDAPMCWRSPIVTVSLLIGPE